MSPRLHGFTERKRFDFYDCLFNGLKSSEECPSVAALRQKNYVELFGITYIGNAFFTNQQTSLHAGVDDTTKLVTNWYARSNIPRDNKVWTDFAYATLVTFTIGTTPVVTSHLADLLDRQQDQPMPASALPANERRAYTDKVAKDLFEAYASTRRLTTTWSDLSDDKRNGWSAAAEQALAFPGRSSCFIVPVRQHMTARVISQAGAIERLVQAADEGKLSPDPAARVWIHFQGTQSRDVA